MYLVFFQQAGYSILFSQKFIENATIFLYKSKKCSIILFAVRIKGSHYLLHPRIVGTQIKLLNVAGG